jgi:hypothetical protein
MHDRGLFLLSDKLRCKFFVYVFLSQELVDAVGSLPDYGLPVQGCSLYDNPDTSYLHLSNAELVGLWNSFA